MTRQNIIRNVETLDHLLKAYNYIWVTKTFLKLNSLITEQSPYQIYYEKVKKKTSK